MGALFLAPLGIVIAYSALTRGAYGGLAPPWTAENYTRLVDPLYLASCCGRSGSRALSTALCLLLGFPLALFISRADSRKNLYLSLVILPFWTSFLVRTYAWMFLLRDTGLINSTLMKLGVIHEPLPLLYNDGAVMLGLVYSYPAVHGSAAVCHARAAGPDAAGSGGGPGRAALADLDSGDRFRCARRESAPGRSWFSFRAWARI